MRSLGAADTQPNVIKFSHRKIFISLDGGGGGVENEECEVNASQALFYVCIRGSFVPCVHVKDEE
jgi:hypothetical protein